MLLPGKHITSVIGIRSVFRSSKGIPSRMTLRWMKKRLVSMTGRPKIRRGFDALLNVVSGDVVSAMEDMGLEVLRVDDSSEAHAKCPAHMEYLGKEDSHPSFSVNVDSGLFGCFSCGFKGQFPDLVAYVL